jgi:hypothetical protein
MHKDVAALPANSFHRVHNEHTEITRVGGSQWTGPRDSVATTAVVPSHKRHRARRKPDRVVFPPMPDPSIFKRLGALLGPYGVPVAEVLVGAWFAISQVGHIASSISPGPAQLVRAGGGGIWNVLAAIAGGVAAVHGVVRIVRLINKRKDA